MACRATHSPPGGQFVADSSRSALPSTSTVIDGLTAGSQFTFQIAAKDATGRELARSNQVPVTVGQPTAPGPLGTGPFPQATLISTPVLVPTPSLPSTMPGAPIPGVPGAVPFWKGEGVGRPYELGRKIGAASRELAALSDKRAAKALREEFHLDELATRNLLAFIREQEGASALPTDRTIVVERFRDEIGDWRVCILTPFGGRVHAPWSMALSARLRDTLSLEAQSLWSDDGIALHLPTRTRRPRSPISWSTRTSSRSSSSRRSGRRPSSAPGSARTLPARS